MTRIAVLLLALLAFLSGPVAPAGASWASSAAGSATATATTLAPPTSLAGSCSTVLSAAVDLRWTATTAAWATGYELRWGSAPGSYSTTVSVTATSYTTPALGAGTWYFAVRAVKSAWRSPDSNVVSKTVTSVLGIGLTCG